MLGRGVRAAVSRLLPCKLGIFAASFTRFFTASNNWESSRRRNDPRRVEGVDQRLHDARHLFADSGYPAIA